MRCYLVLVGLTLALATVFSCSDAPTRSSSQPGPEYLSLSKSRLDWQLCSRPEQVHQDFRRAPLLWHIPQDLVPVDDVYDIDVGPGQGALATFRLIFRPDGFAHHYGGITSHLSAWVDSTTEHFEVRLCGGHGRMHFEFGAVSQDIDGDGMADTEDMDLNGVVDEAEDVGRDGLADSQEPGYDPVTNPDPNGDNWYFMDAGKCPRPSSECEHIDWEDESVRYEWLNGTEGNREDPLGGSRPDAESGRSGFNDVNDYRSFVIDLANDSFLVAGSERNGWRTYRIPFRDSLAVDYTSLSALGEVPDLWYVDQVRIWLESAKDQTLWDTVEVAHWRFDQPPLVTGPPRQTDTTYAFVRDYEFVTNRLFDLGRAGEFSPGDSLLAARAYVATGQLGGSGYKTANLWVNPQSPDSFLTEALRGAAVVPVAEDQFELINQASGIPALHLSTNVAHKRAVGVWLEIKRSRSSRIDTVGQISGDTLDLKLLGHAHPESWQQTWPLMWRNCYIIPRGRLIEDLQLQVFKGVPGTEGTSQADWRQISQSYNIVLGLDQYDTSNRKVPDGQVDERSEIFRADWGMIIFPDRQPFDTDTVFTDLDGHTTEPLLDRVPEIYTGTQPSVASQYFIHFRSSP